MKTSLLAVTCTVLFLASCTKTKSTDPTPLPDPDYMALSVGNYWIFEGYMQDSSGVLQPTGDTDSAYISGDTVINGNTYFIRHDKPIIISQQEQVVYLRDSSGYMVDPLGNILMSETNFTDTLFFDDRNPTLYHGYAMMTGNDSLVSVPAGDIHSVTMRLTVIPADTAMHLPTRYVYWVYGENVGKIKSHLFFFGGDQHVEARLVRYHVTQ